MLEDPALGSQKPEDKHQKEEIRNRSVLSEFLRKGQRRFYCTSTGKDGFPETTYSWDKMDLIFARGRHKFSDFGEANVYLFCFWFGFGGPAQPKQHQKDRELFLLLQKSCCFGFSEVETAKMISFLQAFPSESRVSRFNAIILRYSAWLAPKRVVELEFCMSLGEEFNPRQTD